MSLPLARFGAVSVKQDEPEVGSAAWLRRFHAGEHALIELCYRDHARTVLAAAGEVVPPVDAETVVHDVFCSLLSDPGARASFRGGSLQAWLRRVARNRAIDLLRRRRREHLTAPEALDRMLQEVPQSTAELQNETRRLIDGFRRAALPAKLAPVFEARFIQQLSQREAAARLGISRTTLALRERRLRTILRRYVLDRPRRDS